MGETLYGTRTAFTNQKLQDVSKGTLKVERHFNGNTETNLFTESFRPRQRKGK